MGQIALILVRSNNAETVQPRPSGLGIRHVGSHFDAVARGAARVGEHLVADEAHDIHVVVTAELRVVPGHDKSAIGMARRRFSGRNRVEGQNGTRHRFSGRSTAVPQPFWRDVDKLSWLTGNGHLDTRRAARERRGQRLDLECILHLVQVHRWRGHGPDLRGVGRQCGARDLVGAANGWALWANPADFRERRHGFGRTGLTPRRRHRTHRAARAMDVLRSADVVGEIVDAFGPVGQRVEGIHDLGVGCRVSIHAIKAERTAGQGHGIHGPANGVAIKVAAIRIGGRKRICPGLLQQPDGIILGLG